MVIIYGVTKGYLNDVPVEKVRDYEARLYDLLETRYPALLERFEAGYYDPEDVEKMKDALEKMRTLPL